MVYLAHTSWDDLDRAIQDEGGVVPCQNYPDAFFPFDSDRNNPYVLARQLCRECPIRLICLSYALDNNETEGVWGGLSPYERDVMTGRTRRR